MRVALWCKAACQCCGIDRSAPCCAQGVGAGNQRRPGGEHIVDQDHAWRRRRCAAPGERTGNIATPFRTAELRLMPGIAQACEAGCQQGEPAALRNLPGEFFGLIKTALSQAIGVQRHRHDGVGRREVRKRSGGDHRAERLGHAAHPSILQRMDRFAQAAFVDPGHRHRVEAVRRVVERVWP
jgi:hypothetical protein